jgi:hypothetical protein
MANNRIQIKRSVANVTVSGLSNGELAFTQASNTLHIGLPNGSGVLRIGGAQYPGTLTNNHALVANTSGGIDKVIVANAVITSLVANGSAGGNGQVLVTNGTAVYWGTGTSGTNTQVQFNDSGVANATAGFTFNKVSNTLFVGNNVYTTTVNATTVNAATHSVGTALVANSTGLWTDAGTVNAAVISVGTNVISNSSGVFATGVVNASSHTVGSVFIANSTILQSNGLVVNSTGAYVTGVVNSTSFNAGAIGTGTGGSVQNTTNFFVGNNTVNTVISSAGLNVNGATIANSAGVFATGTINAFSHSVGTSLVGNSSGLFVTGTVNASLVSVGSSFTANSSKVVFTGANIAATSATAEFLNVIVQGNTTLGNSSVDVINVAARVTGNINPSANVTYNLGTNALRWNEIHSSNLHSTTGYFDGNVEVAGDIIVTGNLVTTNVSSVIVSDPMIYLAGNNYTSDLLDIGFAANYFDGLNQRHTGLFRDASDGGIYKLFTGSVQELSGNNVVNTAANGFTLAILETFLESGAIVSNNTTLTITANSTCNVNITANTLVLSTALAGTEGGTGYKTTINQALLVGNSSNGYDRLSLGTSGYVLQSNGSHLVYDYLDGGSF